MNNFNRQIYSFVFGAVVVVGAEADVVDDVVVGDGDVVIVGGVAVRNVVCAVVDVLFAVADVFVIFDPVLCISFDDDVVLTVDVKHRIS